ncbi:acetyl xylan esterase [Colletotrichum tofieldiae]|nr:acetyl xylan esterase [Colletotrichum tofieldiae]
MSTSFRANSSRRASFEDWYCPRGNRTSPRPGAGLASFASAPPPTTRQRLPAHTHLWRKRDDGAAGLRAAAKIVDDLTKANQGATNEPIVYPACGGASDCLGVSYADSVKNGTAAVATAVNDFNKKCPQTKIVMLGFSQGAQIMDNAYCGGGDAIEGVKDVNVLISNEALTQVKVAIFMGDPRYVAGLPYEVGTCKTQGSFCDSADPFCCNGNDPIAHLQYPSIYGDQIKQFVSDKLK